MAGIGWKLERMLEHGSLGSTLQAYLTGVAVTAAPWLLTTTVQVMLRVMRSSHTHDLAQVEQLITIVYAVTLVLSAPVHIVVSRFAADRLYEKKLELLAGPLRDALVFTILGFLGVGIVTMVLLRPPLVLAVPATVLTSVIATQWLLLAVGGGMSSPTRVLGAFALGAAISLLAALVLERVAGLGSRGYLIGFTLGQAVSLSGMLLQILHDLPAEEAPAPHRALRRSFYEYRLLAVSAFAGYAAIWADKLVTLGLRGTTAATLLANTAALAWFSVIPAFAWIYLQIETSFFRAFRAYFRGIEHGASLDELEDRASEVREQAARVVRGAAAVQALVLVFGLLAAPHVVAAMGLPSHATFALRLGLVAAALQVMTLLGLLLLYYLDLRRPAFRVAVAQLAAVTLTTVAMIAFDAPAALGGAIGSAVPAAYALAMVRRSFSALVPDTFQSQPYGNA